MNILFMLESNWFVVQHSFLLQLHNFYHFPRLCDFYKTKPKNRDNWLENELVNLMIQRSK